MGFLRAFVGFEGRIGRQTYLLCSLLLIALTIAVLVALIATYGVDYGKTPEETRVWTLWSLAIELVFLYPTLAITIKRLHDLDLSGWWSVVFWLPSALNYASTLTGLSGTAESPAMLGTILELLDTGLVVIMWVALCIIPGSRAANRFGPSPFATPQLPITASGAPAA